MFYTYLSKQWHKFPNEIWHEFFMLNRYPSLSTGELPTDICIELARPIYDQEKALEQNDLERTIEKTEEESQYYFACWQALDDEYEGEYRAKEAELEELRNALTTLRADDVLTNPDSAYAYLVDWHIRATISEEEARKQVVSWFETIKDISLDLADSFVQLLQRFFESNNLRYMVSRVSSSLEFRLNPAIIASERFLVVKNIHCNDTHLQSLYSNFEDNFGGLLARPTDAGIKSTIGSSSNLVEALANKVTAKSGETLSHIFNVYLPDDSFPHQAAKDSLSKIYKFFSDYPGIRHGGTATSATRALTKRDAVLYSSLSVFFADYLSCRECLKCGSGMIIKDGKHGKFWGCPKFPSCDGSKSVSKA